MDPIFTGICMAISAIALLGFSCGTIASLSNHEAEAVGSGLMAIAMAIVFSGTLIALTISRRRIRESDHAKQDEPDHAWSRKASLGREQPHQPEETLLK